MEPGIPVIAVTRLRELWIHTGTACNLACPFCHEGSKPGDTRLAAPTLTEITPLLRRAHVMGIEQFAFTGGEPLILKGIQEILLYALSLRPTLVLTNGTAPFIRRAHQLSQLRQAPHPLSFRVSIDYADEAQHDAGRGLKNFRKALEGLRLLHAAGFAVGIMRQQQIAEDAQATDRRFRNLLRKQHLPEDLPILSLPELGALGATAQPAPQLGRMAVGETACARSRMLLKRGDALQITACPLVDDDPQFDQPADLDAAATRPTRPLHRRCSLCLGNGVNYVGTSGTRSV